MADDVIKTLARLALVAGRIEDSLAHTGGPGFVAALDFAYAETDDYAGARAAAFLTDLRAVLAENARLRAALNDDDLDDFIAEQLKDPEFCAAYVAAKERSRAAAGSSGRESSDG